MVERHAVEEPRHPPEQVPEENVERQGEEKLAVFEWYCPDCEIWLGWPQQSGHVATVCDDASECPHRDEGACGHVACPDCGSLADSHEWLLQGEQAGKFARDLFDDDTEDAADAEIRRALLEDLREVAEGRDVEEVVAERQDLFSQYVEDIEEER